MKAILKLTKERIEAARAAASLDHPVFGDLSDPKSVILPPPVAEDPTWNDSPLFIHLTATSRCNARCRGCINSEITMREGTGDAPAEMEPERDSSAVANLIRREPGAKRAAVCIYGGEPLLVPEKVARAMALIREKAPIPVDFMVYTNGTLLTEAVRRAPELASGVWLYSVSIDGGETQHDGIRRGAPLSVIRENLRALREVYRGDVLMWTTLRESQSLFGAWEEFRRLRAGGLADRFFWHWVETEEEFEDFPGYAKRYEADLEKVMDDIVEGFRKGEPLSVVHVDELLIYWLTGKARGSSACGVELSGNYDLIGGEVRPCADLPAEYSLGAVNPDGTVSLEEKSLSSLVEYKKILGCERCGVHPYCGGRCPVQALFGEPGRLLRYCSLMRLHVGTVGKRAEEIYGLMRKNGMTLRDLYERSARFAPYTDVTP